MDQLSEVASGMSKLPSGTVFSILDPLCRLNPLAGFVGIITREFYTSGQRKGHMLICSGVR